MSIHPPPVRPVTGIYWGLRNYSDSSYDPELARSAVQDFVDTVAGETGEAPPEITISVLEGDAAEELIRASQDADMLVVGSRGSGGFARLLLGSVSSQVTHHTSCPVVVIPGPR